MRVEGFQASCMVSCPRPFRHVRWSPELQKRNMEPSNTYVKKTQHGSSVKSSRKKTLKHLEQGNPGLRAMVYTATIATSQPYGMVGIYQPTIYLCRP